MPDSRNKAGRTASGRFLPGTSGNPGGRPRSRRAITEAISDEDGAKVAAELVRLALHAKEESVRRAACSDILDRLHGRPMQAMEIDTPRDVSFEVRLVDAATRR